MTDTPAPAAAPATVLLIERDLHLRLADIPGAPAGILTAVERGGFDAAVAYVRSLGLDPAGLYRPTDPAPKPVRVTVDLEPAEHRRLRRHCTRYAEQLDVARVAATDVLRALLAALDDDDQLAARVGDELRRAGGNRRR